MGGLPRAKLHDECACCQDAITSDAGAMSDEPKYYDSAGHECSLDTLCRREPEWAANRHRVMLARIAGLERELTLHQKGRAVTAYRELEAENETLRQKLETLEYKLERAQGRWQP